MNSTQKNTVAPNTLIVGSKTLKLGALAVAAALALAMVLATRGAFADPLPEPLSPPQLGGDAAVESVLRYIALHNLDVAGYRAIDPAVDSVARYIAVHAVGAQRGPSAEEQAITNYLLEHVVTFGP